MNKGAFTFRVKSTGRLKQMGEEKRSVLLTGKKVKNKNELIGEGGHARPAKDLGTDGKLTEQTTIETHPANGAKFFMSGGYSVANPREEW